MQDVPKHSSALRALIVAIFACLALGSLLIFGYYTFVLLRDILAGADTIVFNKGAMYLLGVGLSSGLLTYFFVLEIAKKKISALVNKRVTRMGIAFVAIIFLLPQLVSLGVSRYVGNRGYVYCADKSYRWLHVQTIVFVAAEKSCPTSPAKSR